MAESKINWTDESVVAFARREDPIERMERAAREAVLAAVDEGWRGPPFDPIELASIRGIVIRPNAAVADARVFWVNGRFEIEYNPHRPRGRVNFSIAHEIAHTFFEDCAKDVQHRSRAKWDKRRWQLELLCNVGAAEITMPVGSFPSAASAVVTIEEMMKLRKKYQVSAEAILIRLVKLASSRVACFSATRMRKEGRATYRIDYRIGSAHWPEWKRSRQVRELESEVLDQCVAIGTTAKGTEHWDESGQEFHVEGVALPPLPGAENLRIAGFMRPASEVPDIRGIAYRQGNAARFVVASNAAILHIVNDAARRWVNRGFAPAVRAEYPSAYDEYSWWATETPEERRLGSLHVSELPGNRYVVSLVAQRGYGKSATPRIRYGALDMALRKAEKRLSEAGVEMVQMPRIGAGQAGGNWAVIEGLIRERLVSARLDVRVFDLPPR